MPRLLNPILILLRSAKNRCADIQDIKLREAIYTDIEEAENFYYENDYEIVRHSFSYVSLLQANNINQENANKVMKHN